MKSTTKLLSALLLLSFAKDMAWSIIIPIWHGPDEQAHFAQVQYYVEKKSLNLNPKLNRSHEVTVSEELLGTLRDGRGNNKFTYHPEFNIDYSDSIEQKITSLPRSSRSQMDGQEAAGYPPLYYILAYPFYLLAYNGNLFDRVYAVRLFSMLLNVALVYVAYKIGKIVWKSDFSAFALASVVSLHPMLTFLGASAHPDNLLNLLYSLAILYTLLILDRGIKLKYLLILSVLYVLGYQTKILMVFLFPITLSVIIFKLFNWKISIPSGLLILISPIVALFIQAPIPLMPRVTAASPLSNMSVIDYMKFRVPKLLFEVWPWYWGVFKWLGVVLPIQILRIITRVAAVLGTGLIFELVRRPSKYLIFFLLSSSTFVLYLIFWDYRLMQSIGWSQGLQGRYLFPNIIPHMATLVFSCLGLSRLTRIPVKFVLSTLVILMLFLNIAAFITLTESYYDSISEVRAYKPGIIKQILNVKR